MAVRETVENKAFKEMKEKLTSSSILIKLSVVSRTRFNCKTSSEAWIHQKEIYEAKECLVVKIDVANYIPQGRIRIGLG